MKFYGRYNLEDIDPEYAVLRNRDGSDTLVRGPQFYVLKGQSIWFQEQQGEAIQVPPRKDLRYRRMAGRDSYWIEVTTDETSFVFTRYDVLQRPEDASYIEDLREFIEYRNSLKERLG